MATRTKLLCVTVTLASCVAPDGGRRLDITQRNALGVTAIEIDDVVQHGERNFELRGLDADNSVVAAVRLHVGDIADLPQYLPGNTAGSEIVLSMAGIEDQRMISREVQRFNLPADHTALQPFLELDTVAATLAHEANIVVQPARPAIDHGDTPYFVYSCGSGQVNTSPTAEQCCYTNQPGYAAYTDFYLSGSSALVLRYYGFYSCAAQDGSACNGSSCFWGPNGFARPSLWVGSGTARIYLANSDTICTGNFFQSNPPSVIFSDLNGSFPTGQGCPGGADGAGEWDY